MDTAVRGAIDPLRLAPDAGTHVVVAGGCGGFGQPLVRACLDSGMRVTVLDLPASIDRHPLPGAAAAVPCDVTDPAQVADAFGRLDTDGARLDLLVYLVGFILTPPPLLDAVSPEQWDAIQAGNLRGAYLTCRAALPLLRATRSGSIVLVSSGLAYAARPGFAPYVAAKAGLIGLTRALAIENAPAVRVNAVAPSASHTAFVGGGTGRGGEDADHGWFLDNHADPPPLGRSCEPDDVIGPILFLAGNAARFMTGQVLHVNGGRITP